ncbi:MAG TPA: C40 family peptidase, partial [Bacillota bacterium]|nr:C40 family peptidase [Bacillota bacterium]
TTTTVSRGGSRATATGEAIVSFAKQFLGVKYVWGGSSPSGFDCSGFVGYVYKNFGYQLNRVSSDQARQGVEVSKGDLKPGDLVFFNTNHGSRINHSGIYIGGGNFIDASSGQGHVTISPLTSGFYAETYVTARRLF